MGLRIEKGTTIFLDTAPFIYYFEKNTKFFPQVSTLIEDIYSTGAQIMTSVITYIEIATLPARLGQKNLAAKYRDYFTNSAFIVLRPIDIAAAEDVVHYRANYNLRIPDAIQLALAKRCGADFVITNDAAWKKVRELNIVMVEQL